MTTNQEDVQAKTSYDGSCHCGLVKYTINLSPPVTEQMVSSCNCSICSRNGYLLVYPHDNDVTFHSGLDDLKGYQFGKKRVIHHFCPTCGTSVGVKSADPEFFYDYRAINVRTLEGVNVADLKNVNISDGKSQ